MRRSLPQGVEQEKCGPKLRAFRSTGPLLLLPNGQFEEADVLLVAEAAHSLPGGTRPTQREEMVYAWLTGQRVEGFVLGDAQWEVGLQLAGFKTT